MAATVRVHGRTSWEIKLHVANEGAGYRRERALCLLLIKQVVQRRELFLFRRKQPNNRSPLRWVLLGGQLPSEVLDIELSDQDSLLHDASITSAPRYDRMKSL